MKLNKFGTYFLIIIILLIFSGVGFFAYKIGLFSLISNETPQTNNGQEIWKIQGTSSDAFSKFTLDQNSNSYVFFHDKGKYRVQKNDSDGNKICESINTLDFYGDIVVGSTGVYFTTDNTLVKIDSNCKEIWSVNSVGEIRKITIDNDNNIYTGQKKIIVKYNDQGSKLWEVNLEDTETVNIRSLLFHKEKLYAFAGDGGVIVFDKNGQKVGMADLGSAQNGFFDLEDNIYLDEGGGNITKYGKNWIKLWTVNVAEGLQSDVDIIKGDGLGNTYFTLILNGCLKCDVSLYKIDSQGNKTFVYKDSKNYFIKDFDIDSKNNIYVTSMFSFGKFALPR